MDEEKIKQIALQNNLPENFLEVETRNGYNIPKLQKQIWVLLIDGLNYFIKICKENNLRYWMAYGALLGTVRHGGFVPWDDDLDVHMPREDYEKFIKIFQNNEKYTLQLPFTANNTTFAKLLSHQVPTDICISLDIFALDNWPLEEANSDSAQLNQLQDLDNQLQKQIVERRKVEYNDYMSAPEIQSTLTQFNSLIRQYNDEPMDTFSVVIFTMRIKRDNLFRKEWYSTPTTMYFEGIEVSVPNNYKEVLKINYGETFMELPPLKERKSRHNVSLIIQQKIHNRLDKRRRLLTYGTFDLLHPGHINLLKRCKEHGDYLIVGLSTDEFNRIKNKESYYSYEERKTLLEAIKYVDLVIPEESWEQKKDDIKTYEIDILIMGGDWTGKFDYLADEGVKVLYLPRTEGISTSKIKEDIKNEEIIS